MGTLFGIGTIRYNILYPADLLVAQDSSNGSNVYPPDCVTLYTFAEGSEIIFHGLRWPWRWVELAEFELE